MRRVLAVTILGVLGGGALGPAGPAGAQPAELPAKVVTLSGRAETYKKGAPAWEPAKLRAELGPGDGVRTLAGSRLVLMTTSGQALRLSQLSQVFFKEGEPAPGVPTRARFDGGWLWVAVTPAAAGSARLEVDTGPVVVTVRGGGIGIRTNRDGSVLVRVYHGTAVCAGPDVQRPWERTLSDEQELTVSAAGPVGEPRRLTRDKADAAWVRWNEQQDAAGPYGGKPATK
ncbi:MAG TPA: FecR domain-containing protein [Methylomirabilota bacterium]|nr:FecR domain-containing protein [Methylomirabilota bacterium]